MTFTQIGRCWPILLLLTFVILPPHAAFAADATTREIQRLLWALGYGANRLDGVPSADTRTRAAKFLAERSKDPSTADQALLAELNAAYEQKRLAAQKPDGDSEIIDRRALTDTYSDDVRMVVSAADDIALVGSCKTINRYRLSNSAPLKEFRSTCNGGSFVESRPLGAIAMWAKWTNGIYGMIIYDAATGLLRDFIEVPEDVYSAKIDIHPNGKEVIALTRTSAWRVNLETRAVGRLFGQLPDVLAENVRFSPDGRFLAAGWWKNSKYSTRIWDFAAGKSVADYGARGALFSADGRLTALQTDYSVVEVRETASGRVVAKQKFQSNEPELKGHEAAAASFSTDGKRLLYLDEASFREWAFDRNDSRELFSLAATPDRAVLDAKSGKLYVMVKSRVLTYNIDDGSALVEPGKLEPLRPSTAAVSPDGKISALAAADAIMLVDNTTGEARALAVSDLTKISSIAFLPGSTSLLTGTSEGRLVVFDIKTGRLRDLPSIGKGEIKVVAAARTSALAAVVLQDQVSKGQVIVLDVASGRVLARTSIDPYHSNSANVVFVENDRRLMFPDKFKAVALDIATGRRVLDHELKSDVRSDGRRTTWYHAWTAYVIPKSPQSDSYWVGTHSIASNILYEYANGSLTPRKGSPTGSFSFFPAGADVAAISDDGALQVIVSKAPKVSRVDEEKYTSEHLELRDGPLAIASLPGGRFVTIDKSGEVRFYSRSQKAPIVRTLLYAGGQWLTRTESGFFAGTRDAADNLFLALGSNDSKPLESFFDALYRPDLVGETLAGDPQGKAREAAAKLDLAKVVASGAAPKVVISSPNSGASVGGDRVDVEATISDQGGGIGKVEWRVNGTTLGVEERGLGRIGDASGNLVTRKALWLEPGDNRVEVVAYNAKGLIASEPARALVRWTGSSTSIPPKLHVLAVGVNDYWDSRLQLKFAVPDARMLGDALGRAGDKLYQQVEVTSVLDGDVTTANLDRVFADLGRKVRPRDVFVFFLAGHGKTIDGRFYFIPQDFRFEGEASILGKGIGQDRLQDWLARIPARKSVLLFDTCESGALTGDRVAQRGFERLTALDRLTQAMGRTVLTAATDDTPALEGYRGHGVFTYALLDALGSADSNADGLIDVTELASHIDRTVPELSFAAFKQRQVPQMKIVGSNFPIASKVAVLAAAPADVEIPIKPTHVVISPSVVWRSTDASAAAIAELAVGTQVHLLASEGGWAVVARDGKKLGYIEATALVRLQ